jgi:hypothetical protein
MPPRKLSFFSSFEHDSRTFMVLRSHFTLAGAEWDEFGATECKHSGKQIVVPEHILWMLLAQEIQRNMKEL